MYIYIYIGGDHIYIYKQIWSHSPTSRWAVWAVTGKPWAETRKPSVGGFIGFEDLKQGVANSRTQNVFFSLTHWCRLRIKKTEVIKYRKHIPGKILKDSSLVTQDSNFTSMFGVGWNHQPASNAGKPCTPFQAGIDRLTLTEAFRSWIRMVAFSFQMPEISWDLDRL